MNDSAEHALLLLVSGVATDAEMQEAREWLAESFDLVHPLPPLAFIVDLGRLLRGRSKVASAPELSDRRLTHALARYREHVVARLRNDPRLLPCIDAIAGLPSQDRSRAVATVAAALMQRLNEGVPAPRLAGLRQLIQRPAGEIAALAAEGLGDPETTERAAGALLRLEHNARREGVLLHDADVFMLENLEGLPTASDRLAFAQTSDAAQALEAPLPKRARRRRTQAGATPSALEDESTYPTGGFSSLSTSGGIENLVTSELAYLEDGRETDLFDVRYVTGELLKYTRDESVFFRMRRTVVWWLGPGLANARIKDSAAPWQRLVLTTGLVVAAIRRLFRWLDDTDLRIDIRVPPSLETEQRWLAMLLREWVESGKVTFGEHVPYDALSRELADTRIVGELDVVGIRYLPEAAFPLTILHGAEPLAQPKGERIGMWQAGLEQLLARLT